MANAEHLRILRSGVDVWNAWRAAQETLDNPGVRPDLAHADLADITLSNANLADADLQGANLKGASLATANLANANLSNATLDHADLTGAVLDKAKLSRATFIETNLSEASLRGAYLVEADLTGAVLVRSNLAEAVFQWADLSQAKLLEASLIRADLSKAKLRKTVLTNAIMHQAALSGANLSEVVVDGADFSAAILEDTQFYNVDLSTAIGLEFVVHLGPSAIDINTVYESKGQIPVAFLRGAGVPDSFIEQLPTLVERPLKFYSAYISYSHKDSAFARRLHDSLQARGVRVWLDEKQLLPGDDIYQAIDRTIRTWDKVLLCCSRNSLTSPWIHDEISHAFAREMELAREKGITSRVVIPLDLDGYMFSGEYQEWITTRLRTRVVADFRGWEHSSHKFEQQLERLISAIRKEDDAQQDGNTIVSHQE